MTSLSSPFSFTFEIRETLSRTVVIPADSLDDAWEEVERQYAESEIVLDESDFQDMEIIWID